MRLKSKKIASEEGENFKETADGSESGKESVLFKISDSQSPSDESMTGATMTDETRRRSKRRRADSIDYNNMNNGNDVGYNDQTSSTSFNANKKKQPLYNNTEKGSTIKSKQVAETTPTNGKRNKTEIKSCQSCGQSSRNIYCIRVNVHYQVNPFYSTYAIYSGLNNGSPYLVSSSGGTFNNSHSISAINGALNGNMGFETVSARPSTADIPVQRTNLCDFCSGLFLTHRMQCDACGYIPKIDECKVMRDCVKCFEGTVVKM